MECPQSKLLLTNYVACRGRQGATKSEEASCIRLEPNQYLHKTRGDRCAIPDNGQVIFLRQTAIFLLMVALGILFEPAAGPFAAGVSVFMLTSWFAFLLSLEILLDVDPRERKPK